MIIPSKILLFIKHKGIFLFSAVFSVGVLSFVQFSRVLVRSVGDPDAFYHLKMAKLIWERGVIQDFPWTQFTTWNGGFIDHHFLFHLLLIPFTFFNPFVGLKIETILTGAVFALVFVSILKKLEARWLWFWIPFLLLGSAGLLFRMNLGRAQNLSLIFLFLVVYVLIQGVTRRRVIALFLISFLYVWSYGGFVLILAVTGIFGVVEFVVKQWISRFSKIPLPPFSKGESRGAFSEEESILVFPFGKGRLSGIFHSHLFNSFKPFFVSLFGVIAGLVINPYFPKSLSFLKIQMFQIPFTTSQVKKGMEWNSVLLHWQSFMLDNLAVLILFVVSIGVFIVFSKIDFQRNARNNDAGSGVSPEPAMDTDFEKNIQNNYFLYGLQFLCISLFFFALTLRSQRFIEYFIPFTVLFIAYVLGICLPNLSFLKEEIRKRLWLSQGNNGWLNFFMIGCFSVVTITFVIVNITITRWYFSASWPQDEYKDATNWLVQNTPQQSIVFNMDWDNFPELLYYNTHNYYIVGMDPMFMYEYDKKLYWMWYHITVNWKVCNEQQCSGKDFPGAADVIKKTFRSGYVFIKKTHRMNKNLERDLQKVFDDEKVVIYKL